MKYMVCPSQIGPNVIKDITKGITKVRKCYPSNLDISVDHRLLPFFWSVSNPGDELNWLH